MMNNPVTAGAIAEFLGRPLQGLDLKIERAVPLAKAAPGTLVFAKHMSSELLNSLNSHGQALVIGPASVGASLSCPFIAAEKPRLDFARVLARFFTEEIVPGLDPQANIDPTAKLGQRVHVGPNVWIGPRVVVGDGCVIRAGVSLYADVTLGQRVWIDSCAVIGAEGYGYERDDGGRLVKFPQIGGVVIEDDVEIGANVCVDRGALEDTIIRRGVKIDNLVHVAHNCDIGEDTLLIAQVCLCGSVTIGRRCWIGPQSTILQKLIIGDDVKVGIGAVVLQNVASGSTVMGNPAIDAQRFGKLMRFMKTRDFLRIPTGGVTPHTEVLNEAHES